MRIIYIRTPTHGRPDPQRHARRRGPPRRPVAAFLRDSRRSTRRATLRGSRAARYSWPRRSACISSPLPAFMSVRQRAQARSSPNRSSATMMESPQRRSRTAARISRRHSPNVVYSLPVPQELSFERAIAAAGSHHAAISTHDTAVRRATHGRIGRIRARRPRLSTRVNRSAGASAAPCVLRVMVDTLGRPAQIQVERSSGLRAPRHRRARSRRESPVPSVRSEWHRAARAGAHPHRVHAPRDLNCGAARI